MLSPDHAVPPRAHEEDWTLPTSAPRAHLQLFAAAETDFQRCGVGPKQQGQSRYEKLVRLSHLLSRRTCSLSLTWQAARAGVQPRFLLTSLFYLEASSSSCSSLSFIRSIAWPRMAKVCLGEAAGSKVTRTGDLCQAGMGHAESAAASFISPSAIFPPSRSFFRTGLRRLSCTTMA